MQNYIFPFNFLHRHLKISSVRPWTRQFRSGMICVCFENLRKDNRSCSMSCVLDEYKLQFINIRMNTCIHYHWNCHVNYGVGCVTILCHLLIQWHFCEFRLGFSLRLRCWTLCLEIRYPADSCALSDSPSAVHLTALSVPFYQSDAPSALRGASFKSRVGSLD